MTPFKDAGPAFRIIAGVLLISAPVAAFAVTSLS